MSCACWVLATSNAQTYAGHALMAYSDFVAPVSFSSAPSCPARISRARIFPIETVWTHDGLM